MRFDLAITGGTLLDPAAGIHRQMDVAIRDRRVVRVADRIPAGDAERVFDASGRIVTPGLIDLHTHLYKGVSALGIDADRYCLQNGVTTAVDAGTSGAITFPGFRDYCITPARTRILAFVNVSAVGLILDDGRELAEMRYVDADAAAATVKSNRSTCVGIKVRIGRDMVEAIGFKPLESALAAATKADCGLMVHITNPGLPLDAVFDRLRPGDIITHVLHGRGQTILENGRIRESLLRAEERGVLTDVGHGATSFSFEIARAALEAGFRPWTISTDLHAASLSGPVHDLPTTMSKFLALGLSLDEVIAATTTRPARALKLESLIGGLSPGMCADVTVLDLVSGSHKFVDGMGQTLDGAIRLSVALTIRDGNILSEPVDA